MNNEDRWLWSKGEKKLLWSVGLVVTVIVLHLNDLREEAIRESLAAPPLVRVNMAQPQRQPAAIDTDLLPSPDEYPPDAFGDAVRYGEKIVFETGRYASAYIGNELSCTNCHLQGGRKSFAAPWVGVWGVFPEYRSRSGRINTLEERINDCFERSMNGRALPSQSNEMVAILAYMRWLSSGVPTGVSIPGRGFKKIKPEREPNFENGQVLYTQHCASCHQADGAGLRQADGKVLFPPLWGPGSFNLGAGMARLNTAAAFIKHNMPQGREGSLEAQEAYDVAAYIIHRARPDFRKKHLDWPKGGKPEDARY